MPAQHRRVPFEAGSGDGLRAGRSRARPVCNASRSAMRPLQFRAIAAPSDGGASWRSVLGARRTAEGCSRIANHSMDRYCDFGFGKGLRDAGRCVRKPKFDPARFIHPDGVPRAPSQTSSSRNRTKR
jgi:hypothetical protein